MHTIDRVLGQAVAHVEFAPRRAVSMEDTLGGGEPDAALGIARGVIDSHSLQPRQVARPGTNCFPSKRRAPDMVAASSEPSASVSRARTAVLGPVGSPFASVNSVHVAVPPCAEDGS
jgi:hypothetical protein